MGTAHNCRSTHLCCAIDELHSIWSNRIFGSLQLPPKSALFIAGVDGSLINQTFCSPSKFADLLSEYCGKLKVVTRTGSTLTWAPQRHTMGQDGEKVFLYIYDLTQGMARQLSTTFLGNTIEGVWHTGIGLFGKEYFFGPGIHSVPTGCSPFGSPLEVLELGYTHVPKDVFEEFLRGIGSRYTLLTYSLLNHNCNNFTDEAAQFLVGSGIPHHILRQADTAFNNPLGAMMLPMLQQLETTLRYGGVPMAPVNNPAGSSPWPNPSAPARSTSRASAVNTGSSSPFPAPFPPLAASIVPPVVPATRTEPVPPRGSDKKKGSKERGRDIDQKRGR